MTPKSPTSVLPLKKFGWVTEYAAYARKQPLDTKLKKARVDGKCTGLMYPRGPAVEQTFRRNKGCCRQTMWRIFYGISRQMRRNISTLFLPLHNLHYYLQREYQPRTSLYDAACYLLICTYLLWIHHSVGLLCHHQHFHH